VNPNTYAHTRRLAHAERQRRLHLARRLAAMIETEQTREGCAMPDCTICRRKRARVATLQRRLAAVTPSAKP
jgi:hypothetical protein